MGRGQQDSTPTDRVQVNSDTFAKFLFKTISIPRNFGWLLSIPGHLQETYQELRLLLHTMLIFFVHLHALAKSG